MARQEKARVLDDRGNSRNLRCAIRFCILRRSSGSITSVQSSDCGDLDLGDFMVGDFTGERGKGDVEMCNLLDTMDKRRLLTLPWRFLTGPMTGLFLGPESVRKAASAERFRPALPVGRLREERRKCREGTGECCKAVAGSWTLLAIAWGFGDAL